MDSPNVSSSSGMSSKILNFRTQAEFMLQNAILMTEMGMGIKEKCTSGEKYVSYLRSLAVRAGKNVAALQATGKNFLLLAQKLTTSVMTSIDNVPMTVTNQSCFSLKLEYEKLLSVIEKELIDIEEIETSENAPNLSNLSEKIKYLEAKQRLSDSTILQRCGSVKSVKSDIDEKYPENVSRDSLIDLNVVNLPPVPEDIFTTFSNKPTRTSSLSSLKSMRKVKLFLQRAANHSDDEDLSSDPDEHDFPKLVIGDSEQQLLSNQTTPTSKKQYLGNIKEESQD